MTIALLVIGDGRDEVHERSWASLKDHLQWTRPRGRFDQTIKVDDRDHKLGFAGSIQRGWLQVRSDHVLHVELDFLFNAPILFEEMIALLERQPHLAQVALKRQAVNEIERAAGGIVESDPDDFEECSDGQAVWTETRRCFTTNPSVYSSKLLRLGWPQEPESEGVFTHRLLQDPLLRFAFWGPKFSEPMCEHIGERAGVGY